MTHQPGWPKWMSPTQVSLFNPSSQAVWLLEDGSAIALLHASNSRLSHCARHWTLILLESSAVLHACQED